MLEPGMIIRLPYSGLAEVLNVTEFSAQVRSLTKEKVKIHSPLNGDAEFTRSGRTWDISANSEVEIIKNPEFVSGSLAMHKDSGTESGIK